MQDEHGEEKPKPPTALVVEDEESWLHLLVRTLTKSGFSVSAAQSAPEGIDLASEHNYDIALIDYFLGSDESGIEVARIVRQVSPNAVIIVLTGWPELPAVASLDAKIDDLVLKGQLSLQILRDRISEAARRHRLNEVTLNVAYIDTVVNDNLSSIAHEIRSPIVSIERQAEVLFSGALGSLSQIQRDAIRLILSQARRGLNLVNGHLELNRIASGASPSDRMTVDVVSLLTEEVAAWSAVVAERGIQLSFQAPASSHFVKIDSNVLRIGLNPLIENSIKLSPPGGTVSLSLEEVNGYLRISIADNGPGMNPDDIENLMGAHYGTPIARPSTRARGTGLGLTIARRAAELHGGTLEIEPRTGGATMVLVLREYRIEAAD